MKGAVLEHYLSNVNEIAHCLHCAVEACATVEGKFRVGAQRVGLPVVSLGIE